ncbi:response regulator transcription factor [Caldanaerobius polysaccharolyticus]|uniref:response regulator transcription factor n=1 Tax=Caldanaerobius polysaccharolyticus TaxID=44256 RepID=UPI00047B9D47|nr:response regulator transcription factor [Caldanaerobius polysaccharolyticus]
MDKVLIIDDDELLVKGLRLSLMQNGFAVDVAYDGRSGLEMARRNQHDVVILDLMLPEIDGLSVCRKIREVSNVPLIMLTAKGDDVDKIVGIEMGADDYVTKPFNTRELIARINALLRRSRNGYERKQDVLEYGDLKIDARSRRVFLKGKEVELTAREYDVLYLLASNPGKVFSKDQILDRIWGYDFNGDIKTLNVYISKLREKLGDSTSDPKYIVTKWGSGYYFKG